MQDDRVSMRPGGSLLTVSRKWGECVRHMVLLGGAYLRRVLKSCAPILQRVANSSLPEQMPRSLARLSASESSHRGLSSAVFTTNTAESDFWYTQPCSR